MTGPRDPRYAPRPAVPAAPAVTLGVGRPPAQRPHRAKPDPNPMRLMFGLVGLASFTALTAAMVPSISPAPVDAADVTPADAQGAGAQAVEAVAPVPRQTRYIVLQPGQTAPPGAIVQSQPDPTPIVKAGAAQPQATPKPKPKRVTRSRQSGQP